VGTVLSIFEGYPAELVARWCAVSLKTAQLYKAGARRPSRQSLRLFALHRDGRILSGPWEACSVRNEHLVDPDGATLTVGQFRCYILVMQLAAAQARELGPEHQDMFYCLLGSA
jgi:hypothetical protein